ncbi:MAG: hypothetical protein ABIR17_07295 [Pseudolysinimonas sp.]|uniref:hypothetical protein n=1 Tax=Pseudolysinimonas sp. TaxID=2680009 RepID=UPI00326590C4
MSLAPQSPSIYQPGVCNIGPAEIRQRRLTGWVSVAFAVAFLVLAFALQWPAALRLIVALPVVLAANGFLQAAFHFCVNFATRGLFNFGEVGTTEAVHEAEYRRKDQRKALLIVVLSVAIAAVVAVGAFLIPLP